MSSIVTRTARISLIEPSIVRVEFRKGITLDKKDIIENIRASVKLSGGRHSAVLEMKHAAGITDEALKFAGSRENSRYRVANALIIRNSSVRLLWNFFSGFSKPIVKNRVFSNEPAALRWLRAI